MGSYLSSQAEEDENWKSDARYVMESGTYCVVCGGPFDIEGDVYNLDPKEPRYQWLFDFRLLGHVGDVSNHRVASDDAEPVNTSDIDDVFLSEKAWFTSAGSGYFRVLSDTRGSEVWFDVLCSSPNHGTLFPLHEACIETSCRAIKYHRVKRGVPEDLSTLAVLYRLLNTRFYNLRAPLSIDDRTTRNDLFDLCACSSIYGPRSVLALSKLEWWGGEYDRFYANPVHIPDHLTSFVFDVLLASSRSEEEIVPPLRTTRDPESIEQLPTELLDAICSYLPAQSVIALHRTSKALAIKLPLDNAFWRDSLRSGSLHPHIWDLDTKQIEQLRQDSKITFSAAGWDWRTVAQLLSIKQFPSTGRDLRLNDIPLGLWNRCRIWSIIEEALELELFRPPSRDGSDSGIEIREKRHPVMAWDMNEDSHRVLLGQTN